LNNLIELTHKNTTITNSEIFPDRKSFAKLQDKLESQVSLHEMKM